METGKVLSQSINRKQNLKNGAIVSLIILLFSIVQQVILIIQTRFQLVSPLIPERIIWDICKQFIFSAVTSALSAFVGLIFYYFKKYLWVIVLVILTLLGEQFIHI
jgi:hypothetical protein